MIENDGRRTISDGVGVAVLLTAVILLGLYSILRYAGLWGETDTSTFVIPIRAVATTGRVVPPYGIYPNGYAYQTISAWLMQMAHIGLPALQIYGGMLLAAWLVLPAWLLYRALIGSAQGALLASVLLFVQPEFLFPILRGTHEKFTRGLMLLALYVLVRSLRSHRQPQRLTVWVFVFYLMIYAMIALNNLLATSFTAAIAVSLLICLMAVRIKERRNLDVTPIPYRFGYAVIISLTLAYLVTFYVYPPARHNLLVLESVGDRLAALFLAVEETAQNPYQAVTTGWISLPVYFTLSLANWLLLGSSVLVWAGWAWAWWRGGRPITSENRLLLWSFYTAFAFLSAMSILVDISGAIAANLQHRMFPSFAMLAAPLAAAWLVEQRFHPRWLQRAVQAGLVATIAALALLSTLKATNEPLLSNKWLFYTSSEWVALEWAEDTLADRLLWTSYDERLKAAMTIRSSGLPRQVEIDGWDLDPDARDLLISEVTRARGLRLAAPLPLEPYSFITYDNGRAQIHHLRPRTLFQH